MIADEVVKQAGISYRQLNYWTTKGYLQPIGGIQKPGSGNPNEYSNTEVRKARIMGCLVDIGFTPQYANKIAQACVLLKEKKFYLGHGVTILIEPHTHPGES